MSWRGAVQALSISCRQCRRNLPRSPHETQTALKQLTAVSLLALAGGMPSVHAAEDTIKVGILHSLSGTMAISETSLRTWR